MPKFTLQHATKIALLKLFIILGMHLCIKNGGVKEHTPQVLPNTSCSNTTCFHKSRVVINTPFLTVIRIYIYVYVNTEVALRTCYTFPGNVNGKCEHTNVALGYIPYVDMTVGKCVACTKKTNGKKISAAKKTTV